MDEREQTRTTVERQPAARPGFMARLADRSRFRTEATVTAALVALGLLAVVAVTWWMGARAGCYVLALLVALAAVARLVLPRGQAGVLEVRSRGLDVALLGAGAVALAALTWLSPLG